MHVVSCVRPVLGGASCAWGEAGEYEDRRDMA
jgi:hypothetical protein